MVMVVEVMMVVMWMRRYCAGGGDMDEEVW